MQVVDIQPRVIMCTSGQEQLYMYRRSENEEYQVNDEQDVW